MGINILKQGRIFGPTLGLMYPIQEVANLWFVSRGFKSSYHDTINYHGLGSGSTLKIKNKLFFFSKNQFFLINIQVINISWFTIVYYDVIIWVVELIKSLPTLIMKVFHTLTSYFHKDSFQNWKDCLMTKLTLGFKVYIYIQSVVSSLRIIIGEFSLQLINIKTLKFI
jgi:hypothetical protein